MMKILSIDTSCDETAASVTSNRNILSNIIWTQASLHAKFGGVMPSLAKREHEKRIGFVIDKAFKLSGEKPDYMDAIAVTAGPGLAIALGVGITKAKEISRIYKKPIIAVNHLEGHILSPFALPKTALLKDEISENYDFQKYSFPAFGLVISGGNTLLLKINSIGSYGILAATTDDALGEALDKAARLLGLGYPGGAILEVMARKGNPNFYKLPTPIAGEEKRKIFTYSGLKTAFWRLVEEEKAKQKGNLSKKQIYNLAASFQNVAFRHLIRIVEYVFKNEAEGIKDIFVGGGVIANIEIRKRLRLLTKKYRIKIHFPYTKKLTGDNAAMIGIAAYYKFMRGETEKNMDEVDREASAKIDKPFKWKYNS